MNNDVISVNLSLEFLININLFSFFFIIVIVKLFDHTLDY